MLSSHAFYTVRSWFYGRELQDFSHGQHFCWNPILEAVWCGCKPRLRPQTGTSSTHRNLHRLHGSRSTRTTTSFHTSLCVLRCVASSSQEDFLRPDSTGTMQFKFKSASLKDGEDSSFLVAGSIRREDYPDFIGEPLTKGIVVPFLLRNSITEVDQYLANVKFCFAPFRLHLSRADGTVPLYVLTMLIKGPPLAFLSRQEP